MPDRNHKHEHTTVYLTLPARLDAAKKAYQREMSVSKDTWPPDVRKLVSYLSDQLFDENLSVRQVTEVCGIADNNISGKFAYYTGRRLNEYYNFHRVALSKRLLAQGITPSVVGFSLGYNSLSAFNSAFKRFEDCSPAQFQKQYQK